MKHKVVPNWFSANINFGYVDIDVPLLGLRILTQGQLTNLLLNSLFSKITTIYETMEAIC